MFDACFAFFMSFTHLLKLLGCKQVLRYKKKLSAHTPNLDCSGVGEKQKNSNKGLSGASRLICRAVGASLQRIELQIIDKKESIMLPQPRVHSLLAQCREDCAFLVICLSVSLSA